MVIIRGKFSSAILTRNPAKSPQEKGPFTLVVVIPSITDLDGSQQLNDNRNVYKCKTHALLFLLIRAIEVLHSSHVTRQKQ